MLQNIVAELTLLAEAKRIQLNFSSNEAFAVNGDAESLRIMLANVIDNAIRYSPEAGASKSR